MDVNVYKIQMVYFFREKSAIRAFKLMSSLYNRLSDIFKTEPQSLPIPDDVPDDVPRCVWNDVNTNLSFSKIRLDFSFNIPSRFDWGQLFDGFNDRVTLSIEECEIIIDRVGIIAEVMALNDLQEMLKNHICIEQFNNANEANISWLENVDAYNLWTYFFINKLKDENKMMFDINSLPGYRLCDQGIGAKDAMNRCAELLKGRIIHVL